MRASPELVPPLRRPSATTSYRVRAFVSEDYVECQARCAVAAKAMIAPAGAPPPLTADAARTLAAQLHGPAYTLEVNGVPVACAGIEIIYPGRALAWALVTPEARKHPRILHRQVRARLALLRREHALRRVEADAVAEFWVARRWLQVLGFKEEGVMRNYGPAGETFVRTALLSTEESPHG